MGSTAIRGDPQQNRFTIIVQAGSACSPSLWLGPNEHAVSIGKRVLLTSL